VPRPPLVLLPPSEGKAAAGRRARGADSFADELGVPRDLVLVELERLLRSRSPGAWTGVFGVRGQLLERAVAATTALVEGTAPVLPAWRRYSGVVWAGLEPHSLTPADRRRILVPSGLYGMTTAADPVADYRLKMLVSLGRIGRLSSFWRPTVTGALARRARGRVVVDLLPAEHAHAFDLAGLDRTTRVVRVRFVDADGRRAVGHEAKSVKGRLARVVLECGLDAAAGFTFEGWRVGVAGDQVTVVAPSR
jgi:cytoplasmic iron level regulating protein YaaA (DUF328/UPF0246 family)